MKQLFYTLEGIDGSGKTTVINLLTKMLTENNIDHIITREPGGVEAAEQIRSMIMENEFDIITEAMLFATARRIHLESKIIPNLEKGKVVICDRFIHSSLAYQGYGQSDDTNSHQQIKLVMNLNLIAITHHQKLYLPTKTFFLDIKPSLVQQRSQSRDQPNRFDLKNPAFHERIYQGYTSKINDQNINDMIKINANTQPIEIAKSIFKFISEDIK